LNHPISIQSILLPESEFRIFVPDEEVVKQLWVHEKPTREFPYWAKLWPSSIALSSFIQKHPHFVLGKQVAEIAAGLGLPSLVAAGSAKKVWCSDISAEAMQIAKQSATLNQLANIQFEACNWNKLPDDFYAEVVLLSDINYEPSVFDALEKVLTGLLKKGCTLLLATPQRLMAKPLFEKLVTFITDQFEESVNENERPVFISIFILKNRKDG
jgi:predicted nicotinamide N-methyase